MFFSKEEADIMRPLFELIDGHSGQYEIKLNDGTVLLASFVTSYETDNDDDDAYDEYFACLFQVEEIMSAPEGTNLKKGDVLEITYINYPEYIKAV